MLSLPDDILLKIFTRINNPFKLQCVSKQFNTVLYNNKNYIARGIILWKLGLKPNTSKSYRVYKNYVSKHGINNLTKIKCNLRHAVDNGYTEVIDLLLTDSSIDPSAYSNYSIMEASVRGYIEIVKLLLADPRVNPSMNNNYAIREASRNGHIDVVKLLLEDERVDPAAVNNCAIRMASKDRHNEVVKLLSTDPRVKTYSQ